MHTDSSTATAVEQDNAIDEAILGLLLIDSPGLWAVADVEREMGDQIATADGLGRLERSEMVHRVDGGFVMASRAAARAGELAG